jgi:uncharacterized protein YciI
MSGYRAEGALCVVLLTYVKPLEAVDALMADHVAWLDKGFEDGAFVVAGRRNPRTGGIILMRGDAASVAEIAATDPFVTGGVATFEVVAFSASFAQPALRELLE